jgi:aspartate kinase
MRVLKFGGTSVGDAESINRVIDVVSKHDEEQLVLVFSAMGKTTDHLVEIGDLAAMGKLAQALGEVSTLRASHFDIIGRLLSDSPDREAVIELCDQTFRTIEEIAKSVSVLSDLSQAVKARLLGFGELLSTHILAATFAARGIRVKLCDARDLMITSPNPIEAEPIFEETARRCQEKLQPLLDQGLTVITQGFISRALEGPSQPGIMTTLGRGGSDYTAALIGAALGAEEIEIWTDVDGIMTADPSLVPEARSIPVMSFKEAAELAFFGARVLHPKTLVPAVERNIPVRVLNTRHPDGTGTVILAEVEENGQSVKSIAYKEGMTLVNLVSTRMFKAQGFLRRVFAIFDRYRLAPDVVATSEVSVAVAFWDDSRLPMVIEALRELGSVRIKPKQAVVCVVGERLKEVPGIVCQVFEDLRDTKTSMVSMGGSEINLSFVVDEEALPQVINRLHHRFFSSSTSASHCCQEEDENE